MVMQAEQKLESDWTLVLRPITIDQTRPIVKCHFWNLTGNDRTLETQRPVTYAVASGQLLTVEIGRTTFEERGHVARIA